MTVEQADDLPDNKLFQIYTDYIGKPDTQTDVYIGFGVFFIAVVLAVAGFLLFLWAGTFERGTDPYWARRMPAFVFGMASVPATMLAVVVLLPVDRRAVYSAVVGISVCLVAVGVFVNVYPSNWNVAGTTDYSVHTTAIYAVGMTILTASTGASLIAEQIRQKEPRPAEIASVEEDSSETYSDEEIERDIEEAMADVDLSWGGVVNHESKDLSFNTPEEFEQPDIDVEATTIRKSGGVDEQLNQLNALKGGKNNTVTTDSTVDNQSAKLAELKQKRREGSDKIQQKSSFGSGFIARLKRLFNRSE